LVLFFQAEDGIRGRIVTGVQTCALPIFTIFVIAVFFITSADSATFVIGMFSTNGQLNPANTVKVIWGLTLSSMAAIVMYFGGGIEGFENMLIISALPFSIIIIFMLLS